MQNYFTLPFSDVFRKVYDAELSHPASSTVNTITLPNPFQKYHLTQVLDQGLGNYTPLPAFVWPVS